MACRWASMMLYISPFHKVNMAKSISVTSKAQLALRGTQFKCFGHNMKHVKTVWLCMVLISLYGLAKLLNKMPQQKSKRCCSFVISEWILMKFCVQKSFSPPGKYPRFQQGRKGHKAKGQRAIKAGGQNFPKKIFEHFRDVCVYCTKF